LAELQSMLIQFDEFTLDTAIAELRRGSNVVPLEPQVFDLIRYLAENAGRVVSRDDIIQGVWGGRIVSDGSISTRINAARKALGDDGKSQRLIKTVQRRGFRFMPDTQVHSGDHTGPSSSGPRFGNSDENLPMPDRPSIVILPFQNLSDDPQQGYLADGLRIDIQNALVKVSGVFLIAAGSANAVSESSAQEAAHDMGVRYVLEGSVRRVGDHIRISIQLSDCQSGHIIWSDQYDRLAEDTFEVLDEITAKILTAINVKLVVGESARVWHKTLSDLKSLENFYRGINEFFKMNGEALASARRYFERVKDLHPELSLGPTWIALTHWYDFQRGWADNPDEAMKSARYWAERASKMADADGQAHTVLSHVYLLDRRFDDALSAGREAIANRPNCTHANGFYANVLHYCGEQETALHHIKLAIRYSPIHPPLFKNILAAVCRGVGNLDDAVAAAEDASVSNSSDLMSRVLLASLHVKKENLEMASNLVNEIDLIDPAFSLGEFAKRQPYKNDEFLNSLLSELKLAGLRD
jgi:TolB-like protein